MKKVFKRLFMSLGAIVLLASLSIPVFAAEPRSTVDRDYYKESVTAGTWQASLSYAKENSTSVYVKPRACPNGTSKMQTWTQINGSYVNKTQFGTVYLELGSKYGIYNLIWEHGGRMVYLVMTPNNGSGTMSGVWSADSVHESGMIYV